MFETFGSLGKECVEMSSLPEGAQLLFNFGVHTVKNYDHRPSWEAGHRLVGAGHCYFRFRKTVKEFNRATNGDVRVEWPQYGYWKIGTPSESMIKDPLSGLYPLVEADVKRFGNGGSPLRRGLSPRPNMRTRK